MPTAIEYFKLLPKTNCGDCGSPTCLAFAMQLANQKARIEDCPHVSDEAKASLAESSAPPLRMVSMGVGPRAREMGEETVLYRHERRFVHPTCYAMRIVDTDDVKERIEAFNALTFERIGEVIDMDMVAVSDTGDGERFASAVRKVREMTDRPLILLTEDADNAALALAEVPRERPLLHAARADDVEAFASLAKEHGCPLAIRADDVDSMADLADRARKLGVEDLVIDLDSDATLRDNTVIRRNAIKRTFRGLGYPIMCRATDDDKGMVRAMVSTLKYGSLVVFDDLRAEKALPLFVLRQNIYTDPQVPIQVKPELYPVNEPDETSPVLFTTNFSLTYFTVASDCDRSRVPLWLQVVDTEGLSVLTAYSAGKMTPQSVADALEESDAKAKSSGVLVIPGMVARMSGKLEELSGMRVIVGPRESSGIPKALKDL